MIELEGAAIAFGGLYQNFRDQQTGENSRGLDHHPASAVAAVGQYSCEIDASDARPYG